MPPHIAKEPHAAVKPKSLASRSLSYLRKRYLITYRTWFEPNRLGQQNDSVLEWSPLDPEGPIQFARCIMRQATWRIGDWAYFKSKAWIPEGETEAAAIQFVQRNAPSVPVPTVLEHYVDPQAGRSYILLSNVPGEDLNDAWKKLDGTQRGDFVAQVVEHIHNLAQLKSDMLASAEGEIIFEPYPSGEGPGGNGLLQPGKSIDLEEIWGAEQNEFFFQHADLGPGNIKVGSNWGSKDDWALGLGNCWISKEWIATKVRVGAGLNFDWNRQGDETIWRANLG